MRPRKTILLIFGLFLYTLSVQAVPDNIQNLIQQIDTAKKEKKASLYNQLSKAYWKVSNEKSLEAAKKALEFAQEQQDSNEIAASLNRIGNAYSHLGIYQKAIDFYLKSFTLNEQLGNQQKVADLYSNIGLVYMRLGETTKSLEYLENSRDIGTPLNDKEFLGSINQNLGAVYQAIGDYEKAWQCHQKALEIYTELKDSTGIAKIYNNLGNYAKENNKIQEALDYYAKSIEIKRKIGNLYSLGSSLSNLAVLYMTEEKNDTAYEYIQELEQIAEKTNDLYLKNSVSLLLTAYHEEKNDINKAYDYLNAYLITKDSLYQQQKTAVIADLEARYKIEAKDREIELLKKDNQIQILESKKHKIQRNATMILALLITALASLLYAAYFLKRKNNRKLEEKNTRLKESEQIQKELNGTKDKLFSIIAHDLINPFNAILGFSEYLERNYKRMDEEDRINSAENIHQASQQAYNLLNNLLQWARSQTGKLSYRPFNLKLHSIVHQNVLLYKSNVKEKSIRIDVKVDEDVKVYSDEHLLSTVIRNLLSNAIKFSNPNGIIKIEGKQVNGAMQMAIIDNGVGISPKNLDQLFKMEHNFTQPGTLKEPGTGLGLVLCKEFVEKNQGKIWVESELGKGSSFIFTIPLPKE